MKYYDYVIVTHLPAFYKVNLYNEMASRMKLLVIFLGDNTLETRSGDFAGLDTAIFSYVFVHHGHFEQRNKWLTSLRLLKIIWGVQYNKLIVGGWDLPESWVLAFASLTKKNALALESGIESITNGVKGWLKRIFLTRLGTVFASGEAHKAVVRRLGFRGDVFVTLGVGIINKPPYVSAKREYQAKYLYIGRMSHEKNVDTLLSAFAQLHGATLTCVGVGPELASLQASAPKNVTFLGSVDNAGIKNLCLTHDFLILPSLKEPWGLVVEEALYFGLPVIASELCGAAELIKYGKNGFVLNMRDLETLTSLIRSIDSEFYSNLVATVDIELINLKDEQQIASYVNAIQRIKKSSFTR